MWLVDSRALHLILGAAVDDSSELWVVVHVVKVDCCAPRAKAREMPESRLIVAAELNSRDFYVAPRQ